MEKIYQSVLKITLIIGTVTYYFIVPKSNIFVFFLIIGASLVIPDLFVKNKSKFKVHSKRVKSSVKKLTDVEIVKTNVDELSGDDFERLIELYYIDKGYQVQRIGGSGDHGVDLVLKGQEGYKIAVQCKRWGRNVGSQPVRLMKAGKQIYGCYDAWVITNSNFTPKAKEAAELLNIKLINGLMLHDMLNRWNKRKW